MEDQVYCIIVRMELKAGVRKKFLDAMLVNAEASVRDEPGCIAFDVLEARDEPDCFLLHEIYDSQAAFEDHKQTPHFKDCRAAIDGLLERQTISATDVIARNPSR
jgi:quinol monooxygenase YgiN